MTTPAVRVGQIWRDNDKRAKGRHVKVVEVDGTHATVALWMTRSASSNTAMPGRRTRIRLDRFRPTSTGYTLITTCRRCGHSESDHGNASGPDRWHCASCGHGDYHPFYPEGEQP